MNDETTAMSAHDLTKMKARERFSKLTLMELAKEFKRLKQTKEFMEAELSGITAAFDVLRMESIPNKMEAEGIENIKLEGIGRLGLTADMFLSVRGDKKADLYDWLKINGFGELIQDSVNASTLKAFVKEQIKKGKPIPTDCLTMTPFQRASITKV